MLRFVGFYPIIRNEKITTFRRDEVRISPKETIRDIHREKREFTQTEGSQQAAALEREVMRDSRRREREQRSIQRHERTVSKREGCGSASGHQSER